MSSKQIPPNIRERLLSKERRLTAELESEATELESNLQKSLKTLAIIGASALAVTLLYKLVASDSSGSKTRKKKTQVTNGKPSAVTASVISMALQKLLPLAIEKFSTLNSKKTKNEKAAESTSR